jgi:hypothetical protein
VQFVFLFAAPVFTFAWDVCACDFWKAEQARDAGAGGAGLQFGDGGGAPAGALFSELGVCVHDRRRVFWWAVCLGDDARYARQLSAEDGCEWAEDTGVCAVGDLDFGGGGGGARGSFDFDLVGAGVSCGVDGGAAVVAVCYGLLLGVEAEGWRVRWGGVVAAHPFEGKGCGTRKGKCRRVDASRIDAPLQNGNPTKAHRLHVPVPLAFLTEGDRGATARLPVLRLEVVGGPPGWLSDLLYFGD